MKINVDLHLVDGIAVMKIIYIGIDAYLKI